MISTQLNIYGSFQSQVLDSGLFTTIIIIIRAPNGGRMVFIPPVGFRVLENLRQRFSNCELRGGEEGEQEAKIPHEVRGTVARRCCENNGKLVIVA